MNETAYRSVAGRFATGVAVATACAEGHPAGMTVNSFTTVSLDPPLLLVCLARDCRLLGPVRRSGRFALTVLAADQQSCAAWFATRGRPGGAAGFADVPVHTDPSTGCPLLSEGLAFFGCALHRVETAGDHEVLIGEVRSSGMLRAGPPLLFVDGRYARLPAEHR